MRFGKNLYEVYLTALIILFTISSIFVYQKFFDSKQVIISPLPNFLTAFANNQVSTLDL